MLVHHSGRSPFLYGPSTKKFLKKCSRYTSLGLISAKFFVIDFCSQFYHSYRTDMFREAIQKQNMFDQLITSF